MGKEKRLGEKRRDKTEIDGDTIVLVVLMKVKEEEGKDKRRWKIEENGRKMKHKTEIRR